MTADGQDNPGSQAPDERTSLLGHQSSSNSYVAQETEEEEVMAVVEIPTEQVSYTVELPPELLTKAVKKILREREKAEQWAAAQKESAPYPLPQIVPDTQGSNGKHVSASRPRKDSTSTSSSSSSSDDDDNASTTRRIRKRDLIAGAIRDVSEQWKREHGWTSSSSLFHHRHQAESTKSEPRHHHHKEQAKTQEEPAAAPAPILPPLPVNPAARPILPPAEHDVWRVAKTASVCTILAIAKQRVDKRGSSDTSKQEKHVKLQKLALATFEFGLRETGETQQAVQEMLLKPWIQGRSAIEWAVESDCQVFLKDQRVQAGVQDAWRHGVDWQLNPGHPGWVWRRKASDLRRTWRDWPPIIFLSNLLSKWASPKYQAVVGFVCGLVYLALHLNTVANEDYTSYGLYIIEYAYYVFVCSDLLLELYKFAIQPCTAVRRPSTYLSLLTAGLLFAAFVTRIIALSKHDLVGKYAGLTTSFALLVWATPLMMFRIVLWTGDLCWQVSKARYLVGQCIVDAIWVFVFGLFTLLSFWIGLAALQRDDLDGLTMLRLLALGALHTPEIGETLYYQPNTASVMLFFYMFLMVVLLGSLITASFLATMLRIYPDIDAVRCAFEARRCAAKPDLGVFLPGVAIEVVVALLRGLLVRVFRVKESSCIVIALERLRQIAWYIIYLPIILIGTLLEGIYLLVIAIRRRVSGYHMLK